MDQQAEVTINRGETTPKPAAQMTTPEIAGEVRELHNRFENLAKRYDQARPGQRAEIREEMEPVVNRERELRQEFIGRVGPEINQDRVPEMGYNR